MRHPTASRSYLHIGSAEIPNGWDFEPRYCCIGAFFSTDREQSNISQILDLSMIFAVPRG